VNIERYPWQGGAPSRHQIFEDCIARFDPERQRQIIGELLDYRGPLKHGAPDPQDVETVRAWLGEGRAPVAAVVAAAADTLNWASVNRDWQRALERVAAEPAAAITAARSLLESVCIHILRERDLVARRDGDLQALYRDAARMLSVAPDQHTEPILRQVLGGCATIANGMAGMRNALGDAHGRDLEIRNHLLDMLASR
jgi:Abortive infection C-terminus